MNEIFIGIAVSLLVQFIKTRWETSSLGTLVTVALVSVGSGTLYYYLGKTSYWETILQIAAYAGAVYTYIIRRFETPAIMEKLGRFKKLA